MPVKKLKYIVGNPQRMPSGVRVIAWEKDGRKYEWFEGDTFVPPPGLSIDRLLSGGYIWPSKPV